MKNFIMRLLRLTLGLFLTSLGVVLALKANIGYAPWEVFHVGLALTLGLSIGVSSILTGLAVVIIVLLLGEKIGLGTIMNMILVGAFMDLILAVDVIPLAGNFIGGLVMLIIGLFTVAFGAYFYIKTAFGAGPRDSLMVAVARKTKLPVGLCRGLVEFAATLVGWFLGGMVGVGTIISAIAVGFCIQIVFRLCKFEVTAVEHETLGQTWAALTGKQEMLKRGA